VVFTKGYLDTSEDFSGGPEAGWRLLKELVRIIRTSAPSCCGGSKWVKRHLHCSLSQARFKENLQSKMDRIRDVIKFGPRSGLQALSVQDRISMAWVVVCGATLASHGSVMGYDDGVVKVEISEQVWLKEMRSMSEHLAAELGRVAGIKVTKLHLIVKR